MVKDEIKSIDKDCGKNKKQTEINGKRIKITVADSTLVGIMSVYRRTDEDIEITLYAMPHAMTICIII